MSDKTKTTDHFDVVIIGAGISGLTSAGLFSRFGLKVCVLEMDARPGGYIAGFRRKDYRFDSAIHWLNQCGPHGLVTSTFKLIGNDYPKSSLQKKIRRFLVDDQNHLVTNDIDQFEKDIITKFPHEKKGIQKFIKDAKKIGKSFKNFSDIHRSMDTMNLMEKAAHGIKMLRFVRPFIPHLKYNGEEGVKKGLKKYFKDEKLMRIFSAEPDLLSCLIPIGWADIDDYQLPPEGGSQVYAEWLEHVVFSYDNEIRYQSKVNKIDVENGVAKRIHYTFKKRMEQSVCADYVVAACDVETLYEKFLNEAFVPKKRLKAIKEAELYASAITLNIALNCSAEELGFGEEILYIANGNLTRAELGSGDPHKSGMHILASSVRDKSLAPENGGTLTVFIPGFVDQFNNWELEENEKGQKVRGDKYKELKKEVADLLLDRVEAKLNIDIRSNIEYIDVATPITHERYTGNKGGSMMGARPGKKNMKLGVAHYKTPVENLFLSGHWAELGGGIPVAVRAAINSTLLVFKSKDKKTFKLLTKYLKGQVDATIIDESTLTRPYQNNWEKKPTPAERKKN